MRAFAVHIVTGLLLFTGCDKDSSTKPSCVSGWSPLAQGVDGGVNAVASDGDSLYIGGAFAVTEGADQSCGLATWRDGAWRTVGAETLSVSRLLIHDHRPVVHGWLEGTHFEEWIGRWDGDSWQPMTAGLDNRRVWAFASYQGAVIAGGRLRISSDMVIGRWDGAQWQSIGRLSAFAATTALCTPGANLIAAGSFVDIDGVPAPYIAQWDGVAWHSMGNDTNEGRPLLGDISAMASDGSRLYAAGSFRFEDDRTFYGIAAWDGLAWTAYGDSLVGTVTSLILQNGRLVACGRIAHRRAEVRNQVMRWSGSAWVSLGDQLDGAAPGWVSTGLASLAMHRGTLIAAGWFTHAGNVRVNSVAQWCDYSNP